MKTTIKLLSLILALVTIAALFASCAVKTTSSSEGDTDTDTDTDLPLDTLVLKIGDFEIDYEYYRYFFLTCKRSMENGDAEFFKKNPEKLEDLKADVLNELKYEASVISLANKYGVSVSDEDYLEIDSMIAYYDSMYKASYDMSFEEYAAMYYMTLNFYREFYAYNNCLSAYVYEHIADPANNLVPTPTQEDLDNAMNGYVRVKHILVSEPTEEEGEEEGTSDEKTGLELAEWICSELSAVTDYDARLERFNELEALYNEDEGMDDELGYYMTTGQMVEEFEKAAFSLEVGEVSKPTKSTYGYHVIFRLKPDNAYVEENMYPYYAANKIILENEETLTVTETDFYKNITIDSIK